MTTLSRCLFTSAFLSRALHRRLFCLLLGLLGLGGIASTGVAAPVKFSIPAQPADGALKLFAKQSGFEVLFLQDELARVQSRAVTGELEPTEAIRGLLVETGFEAKASGGSFVVAKADAAASARGTVRGTVVKPELGSSEGIRLLVRETGQQAVTDRRGDFVLMSVEAGSYTLIATAEGLQTMHITDVTVRAGRDLTLSRETMRRASDVTELEPFVVRGRVDEVTELDKYVVEGRKERPFEAGNMDIPRTINDAQPYYIFDAKTLDDSGAVNVEDFLKQRLTMNTVALSNSQNAESSFGNTSTINLRGVGTDKTLILVNGRRVAGVNVGTTDYQPDLNGIPLASIERIEVLPSSASGIYGGSAIGGVVNVILKKDYSGGELRATYDNTLDSDSPRRSVSASYGMSLEGGKTSVTLSASWSDTTPLLLQDRREIFDRNIAVLQANSPNFFFTETNPWLGSLPNIVAFPATLPSLILKGNISLNSRQTHVAAGTSNTTSTADLYASLFANAGGWNLDMPPTTQSATGLLRPFGASAETRSFRAGVRRKMLPRLELFADFSYNENQSFAVNNPLNAVIVPITAPTNPFTTAVVVRYPDATGAPVTSQSTAQSATFGAHAELPWGWTAVADYTWSESRFDYYNTQMDTTGLNAAFASGALNPFVDTLLYPMNLDAYRMAYDYKGQSELHDFAVRGSGPLPALPWGEPTLTVGLERRIAQTPERLYVTDYPVTTASSTAVKYYAKESLTDSGYAEATIPLIKQAWLPGIYSLDLQASARVERYTVDGGTPSETLYFERNPVLILYGAPLLNNAPYFAKTSYTSNNETVGLKYQPVSEVTLRVSRATAFLPPTPSQLIKNPMQSTTPTNINDPVMGPPLVPVFTLSGGNPDLKPQNSESLNMGIIWEPKWKPLQGVRLNAEYYKIEQFDVITSLSAQTLVTQESAFPGRVIRDATGKITLIDASMVNLYRRETEGWDLSGSYTLNTPAGVFGLNATQSIMLHLKEQYSQTQPEYEAAGYHPSEPGAPKYKGNATFTWNWKKWNAGWTTRYFGSYKQNGAAGGPLSRRSYNGGEYSYYINLQGSKSVPTQVYHDLFVSYAFGERPPERGFKLKALSAKLADGLTVQLGVRNVFDKVPPLDAYYVNTYYLSPFGDMRLRSYWLSVKKAF